MASFLRYLLTAGTATCIDIAVVQALLFLNFLHNPLFFALAIVLGCGCGLAVNFLLSRRFVFATDGRSPRQQFASFAVVAAGGLGLRLLIAYGLIAAFSLPAFLWIATLPIPSAPERLAHLAAVALVTVYSFFAHKHISFTGGFLNRLSGRATVVL